MNGGAVVAHRASYQCRWPLAGVLLALVIFLWPHTTRAAGASLNMTPAAGVFEVGSLVDVSFVVDTGDQSINTIQADVLFPADKLQVVNPVASTSFISIWATAPSYSNTDGTLSFQGGLPNPGIKTSAGIISTVTFRVKSAGTASLRYAPTSRVLLNNGEGTNILTSSGSATFTLKIPPPAGPIVTSPTHPDMNAWFNNPQVQFQWDVIATAVGYSYLFDQSSKTVPPENVTTTSTAVNLKATSDGVWYFHIRARTDAWGGVTSYPVQIDTTPPASFVPKFDQTTITTEDIPTLRFVTTDAASGIDHYEVKQVAVETPGSQVTTLFVETASPMTVTKLPAGTYQYIVRAFDRAGNSIDASTKLTVIAAGLPFYARVPLLRNPAVANSVLLFLGLVALVLIVLLILRRFRVRATFQHDLAALEHDAMKKSQALERELEELRRAQQLVNQDLGNMPPPAGPPQSTPTVTPPPVSPYRYQPPLAP